MSLLTLAERLQFVAVRRTTPEKERRCDSDRFRVTFAACPNNTASRLITFSRLESEGEEVKGKKGREKNPAFALTRRVQFLECH